MPTIQFDRNNYLIGLVASVIYIYIIGYLALRQYLCNSVTSAVCPGSPFTFLHLLMHSAFFGYCFVLLRNLPTQLKWKWYLLCLTVFAFVGIVFMQRFNEVNSALVYLAFLLSLTCFAVLIREDRISGAAPKKIKIILAVIVGIGLLMLLKTFSGA